MKMFRDTSDKAMVVESPKAVVEKNCVKDKGVCEGCEYFITYDQLNAFVGTCDYATLTGKSRLVKEMENGGFKKDSCICYKKGTYHKEKVRPMVVSRRMLNGEILQDK